MTKPAVAANESEKFHPPRAPPDHLRLQSFQILSRLSLIPSFRPWLNYTAFHVPRRRPTPVERLFDCLAFGAPLGTLLALLGSPPIRQDSMSGSDGKGKGRANVSPEEFDFEGIRKEERVWYFGVFLQRVQMMEAQGKLAYGEVLRSEDFLNGGVSGFGKVLRTVYRLLVALEETYPGIFVAPPGSNERREELLRELLETEQAHINVLNNVFDAASMLSDGLDVAEPCLESLLIDRSRLVQYHNQVIRYTEGLLKDTSGSTRWTEIFGLDDDTKRTKVFGAYRMFCINYLSLVGFLENTEFEPHLVHNARIILEHISTLISRISNYNLILKDILDVILPTDDRGYNSLCEAVLRMDDISETMDEVGLQLRTMRSARILKGRAYVWTAPDPEDLGILLLDDCSMNSESKERYSLFFYESLLLCCTEGFDRRAAKPAEQVYPIYAWEMGPALRRTSPLDIVHAIPVSQLDSVYCPDSDSIRISWVDKTGVVRFITFVGMSYPQWDQWLSTLEPYVPPIFRPPSVPDVTFNEGQELLSEDEDENGHLSSHPRPWSLIARKGPRSESSSFINQEPHDHFLQISPGVLSTLFNNNTPELDVLRSPSPLSLTHAVLSSDRPPTPPAEDGFGPSGLLDLTGQVTRHGRYASAHGGFSDVWKGVWQDGDRRRNVAVKVLRARINDPDLEDKMIKRLRRELSIWKNLDHPHILSLLGTTADFGHYSSMVCPWMENGSVSKHMEHCGDIISTSDRLRLLREVADGLSYLHSRSIVHGDLTGSNILIDDDGKACLCDFGLSTIAVEFHSASYLTSTIGGAVRWADALLYRVHDRSPIIEGGNPPPSISTRSDIYSFGSVMLEILSGRIPYHYIRGDAQVVIELHKGNKPRRPAPSFVSDQQWEFISRCWCDDSDRRPLIEEVCQTMQTFYSVSLRC